MTQKAKTSTLKDLLSPSNWWIEEKEFDIHKINYYETVFTVGNGYLGTRGSLEDTHTAGFPQTFINGVFDQHDSTISHMVCTPNWVPITILANNEHLSMQNAKIIEFHRILDIKQGLLYRLTRFIDPKGNITRYETLRYASLADPHSCEIQGIITPENYSGEIIIRSVIDGHTFNLDRIPAYSSMAFDPEVRWHKWAKSKHLAHIATKPLNDNNLYLEMKTLDRPHHIAYGSNLNILSTKKYNIYRMCDYESTHHVATVDARKGVPIRFEKIVSIYTSRDVDKTELKTTCEKELNKNQAMTFMQRLTAHKKAWEQKWQDSDVIIKGDEKAQHALRFCIYHLLIAASETDPHTNIGAKSLSGEGYKGHIFWDTEIFTLPFFVYTQPKTARNLLMYRYNTLKAAKENAEATGYKGARYAWESADYGHEETPKWSADGIHRIWTGEEEIHVTADVVYGIGTYFAATLDYDFLINYGAPIIFETARFWASRLEYNKAKGHYGLSSIIGPDEYHEHVNNGVFTNWMAKWNLQKAVELYHFLTERHIDILKTLNHSLKLGADEIDNWGNIAKKVHILYDQKTKLFEEFEEYFQLRDVKATEWDDHGMPIYPEGFGDFNCSSTMLVKQADVLALLYLLADEFDDEVKKINYNFYEPRTMHGSSLSPSMHAIMAIETRNTEKAVKYFDYTSCIDLHDHKGSTQDGIHIAAAGGTWLAVISGFGGMRVKNRKLTFKPWIPENWQEIRFQLKWHGENLKVAIRENEAEFFWESQKPKPLSIELADKELILPPQQKIIAKRTPEKKRARIKHKKPPT